jgi:hypothetical protein
MATVNDLLIFLIHMYFRESTSNVRERENSVDSTCSVYLMSGRHDSGQSRFSPALTNAVTSSGPIW